MEGALDVPRDARAVVVTEGYTDAAFLRASCKAADRNELIDGVHFVPAGGTSKLVLQAILAEQATSAPVVALLDNDINGRVASDKLKSFNWSAKKEILLLSAAPDACPLHDSEIEDFMPSSFVGSLVQELGEDVAVDAKINCKHGGWHLALSESWKDEALARVNGALRGLAAEDLAPMVWIAEEIHRRADAIRPAKDKRLSR